MINLVLDSTVLKAHRKREHEEFIALNRLAEAGHVKIHIPYYVKYELLTELNLEHKSNIDSIRNSLKAMKRRGIPSSLEKGIASTEEHFSDSEQIIWDFLEEDFDSWLNKIDGEIHGIKPEHGERVTQDYFSGQKPFKVPKARKDFPDAFIWQNILDLTGEIDGVHIITNDKGLRETCETVKTLTTHKKLADFIELKQCQEWLKEGIRQENVELVINCAEEHEEKFVDLIKEKLPIEIAFRDVNSSLIPNENKNGLILISENPHDIFIDYMSSFYLGAGKHIFPFTSILHSEVNYALFKGDLHSLDRDRIKTISISDRNKHYFDISETFVSKVSGTLVLSIDVEKIDGEVLDNQRINQIINSSAVKLDQIIEIDLLSLV